MSGKYPVEAIGGFRSFITFIDDAARFTHLYLLKNKIDVAEAIRKCILQAETQGGNKVKRFRSDNGEEYINQHLEKFFADKGIKHETIVPHSHESNGVAEWFNRRIHDMVRTAGVTSGLPRNLWGEAMAMQTHVKNRLPHSNFKNITPFEVYTGHKPTIGHLRIFGEKAYYFIWAEKRKPGTKLEPRAEEGRICGYGNSKDEYGVYIPCRRQVVRSRYVWFEKILIPQQGGHTRNTTESESDNERESRDDEEPDEESDYESESAYESKSEKESDNESVKSDLLLPEPPKTPEPKEIVPERPKMPKQEGKEPETPKPPGAYPKTPFAPKRLVTLDQGKKKNQKDLLKSDNG